MNTGSGYFCQPGGTGGKGGGGITLISSSMIRVQSGGSINVSGDTGNSGIYCASSNRTSGNGGHGSSGVVKLVAPYIEIHGDVIANDGSGNATGILTQFGHSINNGSTPNLNYTFSGLQDTSLPQYIYTITIDGGNLVVSGLFNISGVSYNYEVR